MQNQHSLLTGSTQAGVGPEAGQSTTGLCLLCMPVGFKRYARLGDLTRHIKTVHGLPSRFLCHIDRCPRSIPGSGFGRKDKLVAHLKSSVPGHKLSHQDAVYQAALHNASHVQAVPQTPSPSTFSDASAYFSAPHSVSQGEYVDNAGLNDRPNMSTAYSHVPHNMTYTGAADPAGWHNAFGHGDLAMYSGPCKQTVDYSPVMYPDQSVVGGNSMNQTMDPSMFDDDYTQETMQPSAFGNGIDGDSMDAGSIHGTGYSYTNNHYHPAWH